ncbi:small acid-soluble spore protein SspI [Longirhabdus pacifica]|uniref:small acid-soluble spore protein SspI n=1 Tax=Longirhabdus pacifica TaxID=2305227 RepID=UPI0027B8F450|nr:small acid-soluble spore protein SspI [Longirhabdus pacifica]
MLSLRQAVLKRVEDKNESEIHEIIQGSVGHDEKALPGLGVLFEIIWKHSSKETQDQLVDTLSEELVGKGSSS